MFSREDWRRAVDLHFMEGMTIRKVVAELGYPSEGGAGEMGSRGPALHGRMQAFVYAGVQDERGQTRAGRRASRPHGARRGLHADERVPVDAPLPERGDTGTDERKKRAGSGRTGAHGRR